ncbi:MAG TPA: aminotransferase class I/II-fold pyridoxal phosphate-dependent enzyme [Candidatus Methanofastidiosa archaeon]|nr:aminotransferase class I/II-fold pyridoxal phosphate-dependent enzyme [Candidatus Methanofastidiosa archaeon]
MSVYELIDKISKMQAEGRDLIRLDIGQPDLPVPEEIKEATKKAIDENRTGYTHSMGIAGLRKGIAKLHNVSDENVIITVGGKFPIYSALTNNPGKTTLIRPCWGAYPLILNKLGKEFDSIDTSFESGFQPDLDAIGNTDMLVINYPNNPTGVCISNEDYAKLADLSNDKEFTIVSDEVYTKMAFRDTDSITNHDCDYICVGSFSKTFSMTGYRLGYAISSPENIKKIQELQQLTTTSPTEFAQFAALAAMDMMDKTSERISRFYKKRMDEAVSLLETAGFEVVPAEGTFYLFPRLKADSNKFAMRLLEEGVSVLPGSPFGPYDNHFRISLVTDRMDEATRKMEKVRKELE